MNIKLKIITTLLGVFFGCGIVTSQTPKAEQAMDSKRQHITEVAALTGKGDLDKLKIVLIDGLNDGMAVSELKEVMVQPMLIAVFLVPCADCKHWLRYLTSVKQKASKMTGDAKRRR